MEAPDKHVLIAGLAGLLRRNLAGIRQLGLRPQIPPALGARIDQWERRTAELAGSGTLPEPAELEALLDDLKPWTEAVEEALAGPIPREVST